MEQLWKSFSSTLIPHIEELKHQNHNKHIYKNILRVFYLQLLKANESYIANKHKIHVTNELIENSHQIINNNILTKSRYFPVKIMQFIQKETELRTCCTFKIRKYNFKLYFYSFSHQLQDASHFKIVENYCRKVYTWFHIILLYKKNIICKKELDIHIFLTPFSKELPRSNGTILGPKHINSGFTSSCNNYDSSIVIFRYDEWFKVLCHETFHFLNLDFHEINMLYVQESLNNLFHIKSHFLLYESYCEFWATLWNTIFNSFSITDVNFKDFSNKYFNNIENEKLFSCFQTAKILHHNTLQYRNLIDNINTEFYKEDTNVFAYYVIKSILLYNDDLFLKLLNNINKNILRFESTRENVESFCKFIVKHYNDKSYVETIEIFEKIIYNINNKIPTSYKPLFSTLNMTLQ